MVALLTLLLLQPSPEPPAEGTTVVAVQIEAPEKDVPRLARYVEIEAGHPLSADAVRHAVELLFATGEFEDVVVEARPSPPGVALVFRPVPAPLLRGIRVEGDAGLASDDVRRITRLRPREPLWPARLDRAARDAALSLAEDGYLEARVTAEVRREAAGADAAFAVRAGPLVRVAAASVEGLPPEGARALAGLVGPKPGDVFHRRRAEKAAGGMRRRLMSQGHWRATVEPRESYDPSTARVRLAFHATPGPKVAVEFLGARPPASLRRAVLRLVRDGALRGDVLEEAGERIEEEFRRRGHRDVFVTHREESRPEGLALVFDTEAGPQSVVASVAVEGENAASLGRLVSTRAGTPLEDRRLEEDVRVLARALEDEGHADAKVEAEAPEGGGLVPVVFHVRPGPRTVVFSYDIAAPTSEATSGTLRELRLRVGGPYRVQDLARDRSDLVASYRNAGFLQAEVTPEVAFSEDRSQARVTLRVVRGLRTVVDHIVLSGLEKTRGVVVHRELQVAEGEPMGVQKVLESQRRLGALGIFQQVNVAEMDPESVERRSLVVEVEEAPRTTVAYGIGYAERDLLRGSAEVTRRNLSGLDRSLSTFVRASFRGNRFLTTYREPYLFGRRQDLFVTGFREEDDRETFDFVRYGGFLQTARSVTSQLSLILRYTFQETDVFNIEAPLDEVDRQFRTSTFSGPSASVVKDSRDDPLDPRRGHFVGADVQLSHRALGGDSFLKGFIQAARYTRLTARTLLALNARIGLARTFGATEPLRLPLPDRFFAGGDYSLRGFKVDTAGPLERSAAGSFVPTGGNALLLGGAELRADVSRGVSFAAFAEAGNVYPLASDIALHDVRYTAGVGLRYKSAFGPLRIDWGYKLNRREDESASRFHFTIGHAF